MPTYPVIRFSQYQSDTPDDDLLLFAAPAKEIAKWAGVPRKSWHVRMLYQRWITQGRAADLKEFWNTASKPGQDIGKRYILGPTSLTIAIRESPVISGCKIALSYTPPFPQGVAPVAAMQAVAKKVFPHLRERLSEVQIDLLDAFMKKYQTDLPDTEQDYVLEATMQIGQMQQDATWFIDQNELTEEQVNDIVNALEAMCRPALVVDGQHRLFGAAQADDEIWLPVVAIPNCCWTEQIYQFVVINEKASKIESSLLTDIFGSSLTRGEQQGLRSKLERSKVNVEERIAAVSATRTGESPFHGMVRLKLPGEAPSGANPYIPELTIRQLIEGGSGAKSWRTDDEFYNTYVRPTYPDRLKWDSWTSGLWRDYWFAFWSSIRDFYNEEAQKESSDLKVLPWNSTVQTNLTKAVTLRLLQALFVESAIERIEDVTRTRGTLSKVLGPEQAEHEIAELVQKQAIPASPEEFRESIRHWFLERGIPVRFFLKKWKSSLDDSQGRVDLKDEMRKAYRFSQEGKRYHTRNTAVFAVGDGNDV